MKRRHIAFSLFIFFLLVLVTVVEAMSQSSTSVSRRCPGLSPLVARALVDVERDGDVVITPCSGRTTTVTNGTLTALELHLLDPAYTPTFSARSYLTVGTDTRFTVPTAESLIGSDISLPVTVSGSNKFYVGSNVDLDLQGTTTNPTIFGTRAAIFSNSLSPGGTGSMIGAVASVDVGGPVNYAAGGDFSAATGSAGAAGTITIAGIASRASIHNAGATNVYAGDFWLASSPSSPAATVENAFGLRVRARVNNAVTFTNLRFLSLAESSLAGTGSVGTSYGIYADSTINLGTTSWFIYSTSTSPSTLAGSIYFANSANGVVLRSPDNSCYKLVVADGGALSTQLVNCNPFVD